MKKIALILMITLAIMGCKKKNTSASNKEENNAKTEISNDEALVMITFAKSSCFGECPTYTATIMPDGSIDYNGRKFMPLIGSHLIQANKKFAQSILGKANEIGFFNLQDKYDNDKLMDVPSTTLTIETTTNNKTVYARYQTPKELDELNTYIHDEIYRMAELVGNTKKAPKMIEMDGSQKRSIEQVPMKERIRN